MLNTKFFKTMTGFVMLRVTITGSAAACMVATQVVNYRAGFMQVDCNTNFEFSPFRKTVVFEMESDDPSKLRTLGNMIETQLRKHGIQVS